MCAGGGGAHVIQTNKQHTSSIYCSICVHVKVCGCVCVSFHITATVVAQLQSQSQKNSGAATFFKAMSQHVFAHFVILLYILTMFKKDTNYPHHHNLLRLNPHAKFYLKNI